MRQRIRSGGSAASASRLGSRKGFSLIELLLGMTILAIGMLGVASMFSTGYTDVAAGGRTTLALDSARQIMEDIRLLPSQTAFTSLLLLNNLDTQATSPSASVVEPTLTVARKFRYLMAGATGGGPWGITDEATATATWGPRPNMSGTTFSGRGTIAVTDVGTVANTLYRVTVTVQVLGRNSSDVVWSLPLTSLITRLN